MKIRRIIQVMSIFIVIHLELSGCSLFKSANDKLKTPTPNSSPTSSASVVEVSTAPKEKSGLLSAPGSVYPAPATDHTGQTTISRTPYPAPGEAPTQNAAYPAPIVGNQASPTPIVQDTPVRTMTKSNPYPLMGTTFPANPVGTPIVTPVAPTSAGSVVVTGTLTVTPAMVRTDIVATNPAEVKLAAGRPQLVEFFGYWCTLCKSMAPVINGLETKYADKMNFIYLNVDDPTTDPLQKALGYTLIGNPHLYLLDGQGKTVQEWIGYVPVEELEAAIKSSTNQ